MFVSEFNIVLEELRTDLWIINTHHVGEPHAFNSELKLPAKNIFPKEELLDWEDGSIGKGSPCESEELSSPPRTPVTK